jgi:imidazolonepropionase-like amidohydrolase
VTLVRIVLAAYLTLAGCAAGPALSGPHMLAIRDVALWDGTGGPLQPHATVLVRGDRIVAVGAVDEIAIPDGAEVVDGAGRHLIPGLIDMHVHALWDPSVPPVFLPLFVAHGVTTVRDMGGLLDLLPATRSALADGSLVGPRLIAAGAILDGPAPVHAEVSIAIDTPEEATAAVEAVAATGADFVKVYTLLPADAFAAAVAAADARGLPVAGHVPYEVGPVAAAEAGMQTIEHLMSEVEGFCARDQPQECAESFTAFREHGVWQVPTLVLQGQTEASALCGDPRLRSLPRAVLEYWFDGALGPPGCAGAARSAVPFEPELPAEAWLVRALREAEVPVLAGTDTGVPYSLPGSSLHDELALLVEAGLTPREALLAATRDPARALGLDQEIGTIRPGRVADMVLLGDDPLEGIRGSREIEAVVLRGRLLRRAELDSIRNRTPGETPQG